MASDVTRFNKEDLVALRAYALWIQEGQPDGRAEDHWLRARRQIDREISEPERELDGHATATPTPKQGR